MTIGIDASRANVPQKTGNEWYSYYLIQELKKLTAQPSLRVSRETSEAIPGVTGIASAAARPRNDIHIILYSPTPLTGALAQLPPNWESRVLHWPPRRFWTQIRLSWEMLRYTPDILFVPSHTIPLIHPKNTITTIHDIGFICAPWLYSFKERWRQRFSLYLTLKGAKKIIIPSEFTKQELTQSFRLKPERLTVIPHGVDCSRFKTNHDKEKIKFLLEKYHLEKPYIFFIGRLEKKKNVHKILQAWTILKATHPDLTKNYQLVLAGRPSFKFRYLLTRSSNQQILTLGFIPDNDVPYLMEGASLFLFPSLYEGFGMPLLEAMASGVPVIAASGASIPEVVKEAAKLVDPHDPRNLAQGIYEILSDDSYRQSLILKGLERVKDFSWEKCAKQTLDVLLMA